MRVLFAFTSTILAVAYGHGFMDGDTCGVNSSNFLEDDFEGNWMISGLEGCTLGESTNCLCAPNYANQTDLSEWTWQCNNTVEFGPVEGKTCPDTMPLAADNSTALTLVARAHNASAVVECDTSVNPTGLPDDPVCGYSDCDDGGDSSAVCACMDLDANGTGSGMQWVCIHSTCGCGHHEEGSSGSGSGSAASSVDVLGMSALLVAAISLL